MQWEKLKHCPHGPIKIIEGKGICLTSRTNTDTRKESKGKIPSCQGRKGIMILEDCPQGVFEDWPFAFSKKKHTDCICF